MLTEHLNARINPGVSKTWGGGRGRVRVRVRVRVRASVSPNPKTAFFKKKKIDLGPDPAPVFY